MVQCLTCIAINYSEFFIKNILVSYSIMSRKVTMRASMSNQITHFGIMGGLYNRKISGRSSMNRATSRLTIPAGAAAGYQYMKMHNLLSKNPLGSGGVGRMFHLRAGGSSLGRVKPTTDNLGDSLGSEVQDNTILSPSLAWKSPLGDGQGAWWHTLSHDGDTLFVGTILGDMYALDAVHGSLMWKYLQPDPYRVQVSPTLSHDQSTLFVHDENGDVYALNAADGSLVWRKHFMIDKGTEFALSHDGATLFASTYEGAVYALKATDGSYVWGAALLSAVTSTPTLSHDGRFVFVAAGAAGAAAYVYALEASGGSVAWKQATGPVNVSPTLSADGTTLFVESDDGNIYALEASGGLNVWAYPRSTTPLHSPPLTYTLSHDDTKLFISGSTDNNVYALSTGLPTWCQAGKFSPAGSSSCTPCEAGTSSKAGSSECLLRVCTPCFYNDGGGSILKDMSNGCIEPGTSVCCSKKNWISDSSGCAQNHFTDGKPNYKNSCIFDLSGFDLSGVGGWPVYWRDASGWQGLECKGTYSITKQDHEEQKEERGSLCLFGTPTKSGCEANSKVCDKIAKRICNKSSWKGSFNCIGAPGSTALESWPFSLPQFVTMEYNCVLGVPAPTESSLY